MPTIPVKTNRIQEELTPLREVSSQTDADTFGAGKTFDALSDTTSNILKATTEIALREKEKADKMVIDKSEIELDRISSNIKNNIKGFKGENALASKEFFEKQWASETKTIAGNAKYENQRLAIESKKQKKYQELLEFSENHTAIEVDKVKDDQYKALNSINRNAASSNWGNLDKVNESLFEIEKNINNYSLDKGLGGKWAESEFDRIRSQTYRDVLERVLIDTEDDSILKKYDSMFGKYLNSDDAKILNQFRKENEFTKKQMKDSMEIDLYLKYSDTSIPASERLDDLHENLTKKVITLEQYNKFKKTITDPFDDKTIPYTEKYKKLTELWDDYKNMSGVERSDEDKNKFEPSSGTPFEEVKRFREKVESLKPYIDEKTYNGFIRNTQADFDAKLPVKISMIDKMRGILKVIGASSGMQIQAMAGAMKVLDKNVSVDDARKEIDKSMNASVEISNKRKSLHPIGKIMKSPVDGLFYKVISHNEYGNPEFEQVK